MGFLRRLLAGLDNRHQEYRVERKATIFAAPIGPKPTRNTHPEFFEREQAGGIEAAEMTAEARRAALERERERREA